MCHVFIVIRSLYESLYAFVCVCVSQRQMVCPDLMTTSVILSVIMISWLTTNFTLRLCQCKPLTKAPRYLPSHYFNVYLVLIMAEEHKVACHTYTHREVAAAGASQWHHPFLWMVSLRRWVMCSRVQHCEETLIPCGSFYLFFFKHAKVIQQCLCADWGFIFWKKKKALIWENVKCSSEHFTLSCLIREDSIKGRRPCFRNVQPFLDCLLLMLCHWLVHTQILSHSALTLSVALLRSRVTIRDSLTQTLTSYDCFQFYKLIFWFCTALYSFLRPPISLFNVRRFSALYK